MRGTTRVLTVAAVVAAIAALSGPTLLAQCPVSREFGPGPMEAIHAFLRANDAFEIDREREKFYLTFNPSGFLKRIK